MTDKQPEAIALAVFLEEASDFYPESSSMLNQKLCAVVADAADLLRTQHAAIERITALESDRAALRKALTVAVTQNEHDMLMTGEELRAARTALEEPND